MIEIIPNWHPVFVHFTLALWPVAAAFFVLAQLAKRSRWQTQWLHAAYWNLWLGAAFALVTAAAGWFAYNSVAHDAASHAAMVEHRNWAVAALAVMLPLSAWSAWRYHRQKELGVAFPTLLIVGVILLVTTAWHGGELVYRHGLGVMSLPAQETDAHGHGRGDGAHTHRKGAER